MCLLKIIFDKFRFPKLRYSGEFPKLRNSTLEEISWRKTCGGGKGKVEMSSHITVCVKPSIEGFIIPPFSSLLALSVWKFVWSYLSILNPSHKICMKEEKNRKETIQVFLMTRTKFLWALKLSAEKIVPKNWKRNQRSHTSLVSLILPCSVVNNQGKKTQ